MNDTPKVEPFLNQSDFCFLYVFATKYFVWLIPSLNFFFTRKKKTSGHNQSFMFNRHLLAVEIDEMKKKIMKNKHIYTYLRLYYVKVEF